MRYPRPPAPARRIALTIALATAACTSSTTASPPPSAAPAPLDAGVAPIALPHAAGASVAPFALPPAAGASGDRSPVHSPDLPAPVSARPRRLALRDVLDLSAGTCAITTGGRVKCLQDTRWRPVPGLRDVVEVAHGDTHTCARTGAGAVYCWGEWYFGPAHHDGDSSDFLRAPRPRRIAGLVALAIESWDDSDFAVGVDGALWGWGRAGKKSLTPYRGEPASGLVDFARAWWWECHRRADGTARCENTVIPAGAPPFDLGEVAGLSVSERGGCAVHRDGHVSCWGRGPVGDDTRTDRPAPVVVPDLTDAVQVSVGVEHSCALSADGAVRCWGDNREGELGDGTTRDRLRPTLVELTALSGRVVGVVALGDATAVWTDVGEAWTWGAPW